MTKPIVLTAALLLWMLAGMAWNEAAASDSKSVYGTVETYRQVLVIESSAGSDELRPPQLAPVYDGRKWGLSTRWDDSHPNALNIRRKMLENGIRGTFYLNSRKPEEQRGSLAYKLTGQAECSVGGHSVSHPDLPKVSANEAFYELMANRITLECLTDQPVNSLAFPFGGYQDKDRPEVLEGVTAAVLRTGYHHCVYASFVTRNQFLPKNLVSTGLQVVPGDRQVDAAKFWKQIEKRTIVNVPHPTRQGVPTKIDQTSAGVTTKFPGLKASLTFDPKTGQIAYSLKNVTNSALSQALLTVSTPPAFDPGMLRWNRAELISGDTWSVTAAAAACRTGTYWQSGRHYVAAQLDFILNGERGRLFTTCTSQETE